MRMVAYGVVGTCIWSAKRAYGVLSDKGAYAVLSRLSRHWQLDMRVQCHDTEAVAYEARESSQRGSWI